MTSFFCGWKRKMSLVTLILALGLNSISIRSLSRADHITFPSHGTNTCGVMSLGGGLNFYLHTALDDSNSTSFSHSSYVLKYVADDGRPIDITPWFGHEKEWRFNLAGFHFGVGHLTRRRNIDLMVPYWAIVIPLSLISASLLLSKPVLRKRPESVKPPEILK